MATGIGQYTPVFSPGEPPWQREAWQATVHRVAKTWTWPKRPCMHRCKTFLPVAALPRWGLSMNVVHLLGLQGPWQRQVFRDTDCLHCRSYGPNRVFFQASYSWQSEPFPSEPPGKPSNYFMSFQNHFLLKACHHYEVHRHFKKLTAPKETTKPLSFEKYHHLII